MIISRDEIIFDDTQQEKEVKETSKYYNSLSKEQLEHLESIESEQEEKKYLDKIQKKSNF